MSTFTNWNGPECCGNVPPKTSDLLALIAKYDEVLTKLSNHIGSEVTEALDVHNVKGWVMSAIASKADTSALSNYATLAALAAKADESALSGKADADDLADLASDIVALQTALNGKANASDLTGLASVESVSLKASQTALNALANIVDTKANTNTVNAALNEKVNASDLSEQLDTDLIKTDTIQDDAGSNITKVSHLDSTRKELIIGDETFTKASTPLRLVYASGDTVSPYITIDDIQSLDKIGMISLWPLYEADGTMMVAVDVPEGYIATNGQTITIAENPKYADLIELLAGDGAISATLPTIDYGIIKAVKTLSINTVTGVNGGSLADVVALIHGTTLHDSDTLPDVYYSIDRLPADAATGTLAIVSINNQYYVYKKTDSGWSVQ